MRAVCRSFRSDGSTRAAATFSFYSVQRAAQTPWLGADHQRRAHVPVDEENRGVGRVLCRRVVRWGLASVDSCKVSPDLTRAPAGRIAGRRPSWCCPDWISTRRSNPSPTPIVLARLRISHSTSRRMLRRPNTTRRHADRPCGRRTPFLLSLTLHASVRAAATRTTGSRTR
jgi:hypothetical protein